MPEQSPGDLIRAYIQGQDRIAELELELKNLRAQQKAIPERLREVVGYLGYSDERRFFDGDAGVLVKITRGDYGYPKIEVEEPPSLDALQWPTLAKMAARVIDEIEAALAKPGKVGLSKSQQATIASEKILNELEIDPADSRVADALDEEVPVCADDVF